MGLVQNLKKRLGRLAERILVELSYLYIIQKEKQTLKKPDNSLHTEFLQSNLTTEHQSTIIATSSQDISEKIIMEKTSDDLVVEAREWSMNKINSDIPMENVKAIYEEFQEWIDIDEDDEDLEILSLEPIDEES
jgi:hypothetical protein